MDLVSSLPIIRSVIMYISGFGDVKSALTSDRLSDSSPESVAETMDFTGRDSLLEVEDNVSDLSSKLELNHAPDL